MISTPIRLSTNLMTFIPSLAFTELWVISMEHVQRVRHASRERLPFRTPGSVSRFGTCLCSNCWDRIPRTCHVFTRFFTLNTPWYFLDFAFKVPRPSGPITGNSILNWYLVFCKEYCSECQTYWVRYFGTVTFLIILFPYYQFSVPE